MLLLSASSLNLLPLHGFRHNSRKEAVILAPKTMPMMLSTGADLLAGCHRFDTQEKTMWLRTLDGDLLNLKFACRIDFSPTGLSVAYDGDEPENYPWIFAAKDDPVWEAAQKSPVSFEAWCRGKFRSQAGLVDLMEYRALAGATCGEQIEQEETTEWAETWTERIEEARARRSGSTNALGCESWIATPSHFTLNLDSITTIYGDEDGSVTAATGNGAEIPLLLAEGEAAGSDESIAWAAAMLDWIADRLKEHAPLVDLDEFTGEIIMGEDEE